MSFFRNLIVYQLNNFVIQDAQLLEEALQTNNFVPCSREELSRHGWVSPHPQVTTLVHSAQQGMLVSLQIEERILPASVIKAKLDDKVLAIEAKESRKVYKKEKNQLKDELVFELTPQAFTKKKTVKAIILPESGWILVNASSFNQAELLLSLLRESIGSLDVKPLNVNQSVSKTMTTWLQEFTIAARPFELLEEADLQDPSSEGGRIKIKGQCLDTPEIIAHIHSGMELTQVAIQWQEQIQCILNEQLRFLRLKLHDQYLASLDHLNQEDPIAALDADMTQFILDMHRFIPQVIDAFGGNNVTG